MNDDPTNALAAEIAKERRVSWKGVYGKAGLNLSGINLNRRQRVVAVWTAAEEAKEQLPAEKGDGSSDWQSDTTITERTDQ